MVINLIGHRGDASRYTENTIGAFLSAKKCNLYGIELDIQITRDRKIVVYHDSSAERLLRLKGTISDYDYGEIENITIGKNGERVPLLENVLDIQDNVKLFIELKTRDEDGFRINEGLEKELNRLLQKRDISELILISFDVVAIREMKEMNINYKTGLDIAPEMKIMLDSMLKSRVPSFINFILPDYKLLFEEKYLNFTKTFQNVIPWSIKNINEIKKLRELEIDTFICDNPCSISRDLAKSKIL